MTPSILHSSPIDPNPGEESRRGGSDMAPARQNVQKGEDRVTDNTPRTTRSWNELRDEATAVTLAVVDAGDAKVTFRIIQNQDGEQASKTKRVLNDLIEHGGTVRILGPAGVEEGIRQS